MTIIVMHQTHAARWACMLDLVERQYSSAWLTVLPLQVIDVEHLIVGVGFNRSATWMEVPMVRMVTPSQHRTRITRVGRRHEVPRPSAHHCKVDRPARRHREQQRHHVAQASR